MLAAASRNQWLFWRAHIRGEHLHAPHFAVTDKHPAEASAGLFAGHLAGADQSIITRSPNGVAGCPGVVRRDRFLGPTRFHTAGERLFDRLASFDHGTGGSVEDTILGKQSGKSGGIARIISRAANSSAVFFASCAQAVEAEMIKTNRVKKEREFIYPSNDYWGLMVEYSIACLVHVNAMQMPSPPVVRMVTGARFRQSMTWNRLLQTFRARMQTVRA